MKRPTPEVYLILLALLLAGWLMVSPPRPYTGSFRFSQQRVTAETYKIPGYSLERGWYIKAELTKWSNGAWRIRKVKE